MFTGYSIEKANPPKTRIFSSQNVAEAAEEIDASGNPSPARQSLPNSVKFDNTDLYCIKGQDSSSSRYANRFSSRSKGSSPVRLLASHFRMVGSSPSASPKKKKDSSFLSKYRDPRDRKVDVLKQEFQLTISRMNRRIQEMKIKQDQDDIKTERTAHHHPRSPMKSRNGLKVGFHTERAEPENNLEVHKVQHEKRHERKKDHQDKSSKHKKRVIGGTGDAFAHYFGLDIAKAKQDEKEKKIQAITEQRQKHFLQMPKLLKNHSGRRGSRQLSAGPSRRSSASGGNHHGHSNPPPVVVQDQEVETVSSESDDKTQPNYWRKNAEFYKLPENVQQAIEKGKMKAKHSEFYYKMKDLTAKIAVYRQLFDSRVPSFQQQFAEQHMRYKQLKQQRARMLFQQEIETMTRREKRKLMRMQSTRNSQTIFNRSHSLKKHAFNANLFKVSKYALSGSNFSSPNNDNPVTTKPRMVPRFQRRSNSIQPMIAFVRKFKKAPAADPKTSCPWPRASGSKTRSIKNPRSSLGMKTSRFSITNAENLQQLNLVREETDLESLPDVHPERDNPSISSPSLHSKNYDSLASSPAVTPQEKKRIIIHNLTRTSSEGKNPKHLDLNISKISEKVGQEDKNPEDSNFKSGSHVLGDSKMDTQVTEVIQLEKVENPTVVVRRSEKSDRAQFLQSLNQKIQESSDRYNQISQQLKFKKRMHFKLDLSKIKRPEPSIQAAQQPVQPSAKLHARREAKLKEAKMILQESQRFEEEESKASLPAQTSGYQPSNFMLTTDRMESLALDTGRSILPKSRIIPSSARSKQEPQAKYKQRLLSPTDKTAVIRKSRNSLGSTDSRRSLSGKSKPKNPKYRKSFCFAKFSNTQFFKEKREELNHSDLLVSKGFPPEITKSFAEPAPATDRLRSSKLTKRKAPRAISNHQHKGATSTSSKDCFAMTARDTNMRLSSPIVKPPLMKRQLIETYDYLFDFEIKKMVDRDKAKKAQQKVEQEEQEEPKKLTKDAPNLKPVREKPTLKLTQHIPSGKSKFSELNVFPPQILQTPDSCALHRTQNGQSDFQSDLFSERDGLSKKQLNPMGDFAASNMNKTMSMRGNFILSNPTDVDSTNPSLPHQRSRQSQVRIQTHRTPNRVKQIPVQPTKRLIINNVRRVCNPEPCYLTSELNLSTKVQTKVVTPKTPRRGLKAGSSSNISQLKKLVQKRQRLPLASSRAHMATSRNQDLVSLTSKTGGGLLTSKEYLPSTQIDTEEPLHYSRLRLMSGRPSGKQYYPRGQDRKQLTYHQLFLN